MMEGDIIDGDNLSKPFPLIDATDHEIIMHRDVHFGGLFTMMLDYYNQGGKGIQPGFSIKRIEQLAELEKELQQNLAALFLGASEIEKIADAKEMYKQLKSIYEVKNPKSPYPRLIADLILSENENAEEEVNAVVAEKGNIVRSLIEMLSKEELYDPLFPGYGLAPDLAIKCLGLIGDKRAIITLFESFGHGDFFTDDQILKALKEIGEPAKEFLLRVVRGRPINEDNERAAIALIQFKDDPTVAEACFNLLKDPEIQRDPCLPTYLSLACVGLKNSPLKAEFIALSKDPNVSKQLKEDMKGVIHSWEKE